MPNEDETLWLLFNGEIYNHVALRCMLEDKGHRFRTSSDSKEVILHLFEEIGEKCVDELRGMFSFAIWDKRSQELFAAVDPFGIKPFYYYHDNVQFAFGSEIKSLLHWRVLRQVSIPKACWNT